MEMAVAHHQAGRLSAAETIYRQVLEAAPDQPEALHLLGVIANQVGQYQIAAGLIGRAIEVFPNDAAFHSNLGNALMNLGRIEEAQAAYERALVLKPDFADALNNLSNLYGVLGRKRERIECLRRAIAAQPLDPKCHCNLSDALAIIGEFDEAVRSARRCVELAPNLAAGWGNLANYLTGVGQPEEAVACYERSLQLEGNPNAAGARLYTMHYRTDVDAEQLLREHRRWDEVYCAYWKTLRRPHANLRDPAKRLRIGYLSSDLREHPVGRFMLPLLANHDKERFDIYCYSSSVDEDELNLRLRQHATVWRPLRGIPKEGVVNLIREDGIDILVDLALMTQPEQLQVFAAKPAPVQVTYLAYCSTSGLDAMDYRLTDRYMDPPGRPLPYAEKSVYLDTTYWCYEPRKNMPEVGPLPLAKNGYVSFGCLNNPAKLSKSILNAWCELLRAIPDAHLLLHAYAGMQQDHLREWFGEAGIAAERIEYVARQTADQYFAAYNRFDIALDPFPYGGGTTSCDALWMGVPVVSLAGRTAVGRGGLSILSNVGLAELVGHSLQEYVRKARDLASDAPRLAELRSSLRDRMRASPLMDAPSFARDVEAAYRRMWQERCAMWAG